MAESSGEVYAVCGSFLREAAKCPDPKYMLDVLYYFLRTNEFRVAIDSPQKKILKEYAKIGKSDKSGFVAKWLLYLTKVSHVGGELIKVGKTTEEGAHLIFRIANSSKSSRQIITWSKDEYEEFRCEALNINVYDRVEAWAKFHSIGNEAKKQTANGDKTMSSSGHVIKNHGTMIINSNVAGSFNTIQQKYSPLVGEQLAKLAEMVHNEGNETAIESFKDLSKELTKESPRKPVLLGYWNEIMLQLPKISGAATALSELYKVVVGSN